MTGTSPSPDSHSAGSDSGRSHSAGPPGVSPVAARGTGQHRTDIPGTLHRAKNQGPEAAVYAVLLLQSVLASGTHIVAKVIVREVDASTLTLVRSLIAALGMGLILLARRKTLRLLREERGMVLFLSFLAVPINQFLFLIGMRFTTPSNAALLYSTTPIVVLVFSRLLLGEPLTRIKTIGVLLGFAGVVMVIFERGISASMQYLTGNILIAFAVMAWSLYTVFGRKLIVRYGPVEASSVTLIIGTLMFIPIGIVPALQFPFETLSASSWMQILYLAIITSVVSYFLWYFALGRIEAGKVALFANLQPILTTILAVVLLGQDITVAFVIGGTIALAGVVIAQFG